MTLLPFPDELLTSWTQHRRCEARMGPTDPYRTVADRQRRWRHPDIRPDHQWLDAAAAQFKVSADILQGQTIHHRFPKLPCDLLAALPQRPFVDVRKRQAPPELAVSSCSRCLAEDLVTGRSAYIRQIWVMACVSFCPRHKWPLTSHCGACKSSLWRWQRPPRGPVRLQCGEYLRSLDRAHGEALEAAGPTIEAWLLLTDFEQELLAVAAGRVPNQFKYNATSTRRFINQVRDICRSAMISCPQREPFSMLANQFRWPEPSTVGRLNHLRLLPTPSRYTPPRLPVVAVSWRYARLWRIRG